MNIKIMFLLGLVFTVLQVLFLYMSTIGPFFNDLNIGQGCPMCCPRAKGAPSGPALLPVVPTAPVAEGRGQQRTRGPGEEGWGEVSGDNSGKLELGTKVVKDFTITGL